MSSMTIVNYRSRRTIPYNRFKIDILFPTISKIRKYCEYSDDYHRGFKLQLNTECVYSKLQGFWYISVKLLGFGFSIKKDFDL